MQSTLTKRQVKTFGPKSIDYHGQKCAITAEVRFDDQCGNGHNTFSITGRIRDPKVNRYDGWIASGCLHEEIAKHFPELAPFIKYHLVSTDGPMHYTANVCYFASDRDYRGLLKGEKRQLRNGKSGQPVWQRVVRDDKGNEVNIGHHDWVDADVAPVEVLTVSWEPVWIIGEGKERELDKARDAALWFDATDEELTAPGLKERLEARLPALLVEFRHAVTSLGFAW